MQQDSLLDDVKVESSKDPVECLGQTFENEEARRAHFSKLLREKLKDPEFRKIEGFPISTDEAILELSDPPYYTACPNPWLNDFIEYWESEKQYSTEEYEREPFVADVSEGKHDPLYKAHSYHTKVPFKAIMRYILHYTNPGDILLDGFCGTGMTGVAAQNCGDRTTVESLGYFVDSKGKIYEDASQKKLISQLGARKVVLNDLSPIATFISSNYNLEPEVESYNSESQRILNEINNELGWMYRTKHEDGSEYPIDFVVWSEVFSCPECSEEIVFSKEALDIDSGKVAKSFSCPGCSTELKKDLMELQYESKHDPYKNGVHQEPKRVPFLIYYKVGKERIYKSPDEYDINVLAEIEKLEFPSNFPIKEMPDMQMMRVGRMKPSNIDHLHHFFMKRPLVTLAKMWEKANGILDYTTRRQCLFFVEQAIWGMSKLARFTPTHFSQVNQYLSGVFYIASHIVDVSPNYILGGKRDRLLKVFGQMNNKNIHSLTSTQDIAKASILPNSLDYIFVDPPFGENIYYSDLNYLIESFHGVMTNSTNEAIIDKVKEKDFGQYQQLMLSCFKNAFIALKPGRWITVEFSNSSAAIWNLLQTSLTSAGFVISSVSALDKKQRSFQSIVSTTAVKQDLVISAYKPSQKFSNKFKGDDNFNAIWDFVENHLNYLPSIKHEDGELTFIPERDPRILFDRVVSYFIVNNRSVPLSSGEFQKELCQKFSFQDGMIFTQPQLLEYEKVKSKGVCIKQLSIFVDDESSAISWLKQNLKDKPKVQSDIHPEFMSAISGWKKNELQLELSTLLEQNFLRYDGKEDVPSQIHTYLSTNYKDMRSLAKDSVSLRLKAKGRWYVPDPSKTGDIEKLRLRILLREFDKYKSEKKKIKQPRTEALRAGFNQLTENQEYQTILDISAKIPPAVLQEDEKLLMFYDNALTLTSNDDDDWD
ncbi:hypothetical protein PMAN_a1998 [Pseudoalteromonas marina]|uniref:DNA methyltransferase n=1 Tax=Pseudoalteromonas marina TaxID=267375 RepID=UPI00026D1880|nr:DNA methyltransferase [Pseudoalteromonas marina]KAF7780890.1 hypothetical protein PMAN_a1998 [Pseudoalteromonas marina]